ncbi:5'-3' exonuclease [Metamycoplasma neophronis]|uniref:5'-3' exonuclease n=1 Tax=Metamycoplasma neophronis TaxID=872983 RepID=A0ABY2YZU1_9BACT|nr:5'-3' exonuclease [Metamycoplasma neophronis]TPR53889.1 5'-3' exonuclease [Metamycoplasma neophronis]
MNQNKKLLVIDGTYLAYRSFYATTYGNPVGLENSNGVSTSAIVAFFNTMFSLIKLCGPDSIYIAFDSRIKTFRHETFTDYKAGRQKAPSEFYTQLNYIQELLSAINIKNQYYNGYEADDIIAKATKTYDGSILIYSADQDLNQLIKPGVGIIKKIKSDYVVINDQNFTEFYDFEPYQVIDYKAMVGDSSDNFKGIAGIGPKSASAMLAEYKTLENIYNNIDKIKPSWAKKLIEHKQDAMRDKYIATLQTEFGLEMPKQDELSLSNIGLSKEAENIINNLELFEIKRKIAKIIEN